MLLCMLSLFVVLVVVGVADDYVDVEAEVAVVAVVVVLSSFLL